MEEKMKEFERKILASEGTANEFMIEYMETNGFDGPTHKNMIKGWLDEFYGMTEEEWNDRGQPRLCP